MAPPRCATSSGPRRWPRAPSTITSSPRKRCSRRSRTRAALRIRPRLHEERAKADTIEEFISGTFRTFFEYVASDQGNFHAIRRNTDTLRVRMDTPEIIAGFEELRADLERAIAVGLFPPIDADYLMAAIVGVAFEMAERMLRRDDHDIDEAARFATALFMGGVRSPAPCHAPCAGQRIGPA